MIDNMEASSKQCLYPGFCSFYTKPAYIFVVSEAWQWETKGGMCISMIDNMEASSKRCLYPGLHSVYIKPAYIFVVSEAWQWETKGWMSVFAMDGARGYYPNDGFVFSLCKVLLVAT
jgi:hypothetical protein